MSSLRNRNHRLKSESRRKYFLIPGTAFTLIAAILTAPAQALAPQPTMGLYLDKPFVEGSYVAENYPTETSVTTFNDQTYGSSCSIDGSAHITALFGENPACYVISEINYGGASTTSSSPVVGQDPSNKNYAQVGSDGISIVFDSPQTYFGLWWSAGNGGNSIQIKNGDNLLASTTADDISSTLYGSGSITALNGDSYAKRFYLGNPVDWHETGSPSDLSDQDPDNTFNSYQTLAQEPFVYIHFIAASGQTFDHVNLYGTGFEFDNLTYSSASGIDSDGIPSQLVLQRQLYAPNYVDFDANGGVGSVPRQYSVDNAAGYLQSNCLNYSDPTLCISAPNNSYSSYVNSWNTSPDGTGDSYDTGSLYPFTSSQTLYAQWKTYFAFMNTTNSDFNATNVWDYADYDSEYFDYLDNLSDLTLPSPERPDQYLEGWYAFDLSSSQLHRVGGPGDVIPASTYTAYDYYYFARWVDNPPPPPPPATVDAITPQVLLVYPKSSSVILPNMPIVNDSTASICLAESDSSGNAISSDLNFTDRYTSVSGESSSFTISSSGPLLATTSRYLKISVSLSSDPTCIGGTFHVVELRLLGAELSNRLPIFLTSR